jgi:hypothetical protein
MYMKLYNIKMDMIKASRESREYKYKKAKNARIDRLNDKGYTIKREISIPLPHINFRS